MRNDDINLKEAFCYLAEGLIKLCDNLKANIYEIPWEYEKGTNMLFKYTERNGLELFPMNLRNQVQLYKKPFNKWENYNEIVGLMEEFEYPLYDEGDIATCDDIKNEFIGNSKATIKIFFEEEAIFNELKKLCNEEEYTLARKFLSENILCESSRKLKNRIRNAGITNEKIIDLIEEKFYIELSEDYKKDGIIAVCNYCGYPLRSNELEMGCCSKKCRKAVSIHKPKKPVEKKNCNLVLKRLFHIFIARPSIPELEIYMRFCVLKEQGNVKDVLLYPKKDAADIMVIFNDEKSLVIDVKDYANPKALAYDLNNDNISKRIKSDKMMIVVPDYLVSLNHKYIDTVNNRLKKNLASTLSVTTIENMMKGFEKI